MKESQQTEFKLNWRDEYLKHLCAFANGQGGRLCLGIEDNGTVSGVKNAKKLLEDIPNKAIQRLGITVDLELKEYSNKGELTRAAILLFGKRPHKYIRTATVKLGRFGVSDTDLISHDIIEGNILEMPDRILDLLRTKYLSSPIYYEGIERKERLEYPEKALREALLNAIVQKKKPPYCQCIFQVWIY